MYPCCTYNTETLHMLHCGNGEMNSGMSESAILLGMYLLIGFLIVPNDITGSFEDQYLSHDFGHARDI